MLRQHEADQLSMCFCSGYVDVTDSNLSCESVGQVVSASVHAANSQIFHSDLQRLQMLCSFFILRIGSIVFAVPYHCNPLLLPTTPSVSNSTMSGTVH